VLWAEAGSSSSSSSSSRHVALPMRFCVLREPVTWHIPLHRFVAFFASQVQIPEEAAANTLRGCR
jgi:hypothetical protein